MQNVTPIETSGKSQVRHSGIEIVPSAGVSRRYFSGPRPGRRYVCRESTLSRHDRIVVLRGQLKLMRMQLQAGLEITVGSIARVERLASTLETEDAA